MELSAFQKLCDAASELLGLEDTTALGDGDAAWYDDVAFEAAFVEGDRSFLLLADIGAIAPEDCVSVYESLLAMQLSSLDAPDIRFGFHPLQGAAVFCVPVTLDERCDGAWLAARLRATASQVRSWRHNDLAGRALARSFHDGAPHGDDADDEHDLGI